MIYKCQFSVLDVPVGGPVEVPRDHQQPWVCSRIAEELPGIGPRGETWVTVSLICCSYCCLGQTLLFLILKILLVWKAGKNSYDPAYNNIQVVICLANLVKQNAPTHVWLCVFRFKRQWKSLQDGNSCSERKWNNGGWRQFWSFSFYWTSWETTASGRTLNGLMPVVPLYSPMLTSHHLMSFINWWDLTGTMMSGVRVPLIFNATYI